jgi:hypothetical protein
VFEDVTTDITNKKLNEIGKVAVFWVVESRAVW